MNNYVCENCGESITYEQYRDFSICDTCKKMSKKERQEYAFKMFLKKQEEKKGNVQ